MTRLRDKLISRIGRVGPISVAEYMTECLLHPDHGYYTTRDPIGAVGDFTTAPEISQMFGECVGLAMAQCRLDHGAPDPFILCELGPGRGTLMADILRATQKVPGFHAALELHLIEASPTLRDIQNAKLQGHQVIWHSHISDLPEAPVYLIANEFFDALPIRQFQRDGESWRERQIGTRDGKLTFGLGGPTSPDPLIPRLNATTEGQIVELCTPAAAIAGDIARRISDHGGAAIIIDYGDWRSIGDTLQALRDHAPDPVLARPGVADLTAHVDFEALANVANSVSGIKTSALTGQGVFLERLGITARAQHLAQKLQGQALESHIAAHRRLTHPSEMGTLFKTIAICREHDDLPPGFVHDTGNSDF